MRAACAVCAVCVAVAIELPGDEVPSVALDLAYSGVGEGGVTLVFLGAARPVQRVCLRVSS